MAKIRLTRYGEANEVISDRLIESDIEFRNGPSEKHFGPLRVDYLASNSDELQGLIKYLTALVDELPIPEKQKKETKTSTAQPLDKDSIKELITHAFTKNKTQEELMEYLRTLNFVFVDTQSLRDIGIKNGWTIQIEEKHEKYQWMLRQLKEAKNPLNNKYDIQVFFGIKIVGQKYPRVRVYEMGQYTDTRELHWKDEKGMNFKVKEKLYKFPEPMSYEERSKWRTEHKKVLNDPNYTPTNFFTKWLPYVTQLKPEQELKKIINKGKDK